MLESLNLSKFKLNSLITFELGPKRKIQRFRVFYREGWSPVVGCFLGFCPFMDWLLFRKECSLICETAEAPSSPACGRHFRGCGPQARLRFSFCQNLCDTVKHHIGQTWENALSSICPFPPLQNQWCRLGMLPAILSYSHYEFHTKVLES